MKKALNQDPGPVAFNFCNGVYYLCSHHVQAFKDKEKPTLRPVLPEN